ncbi:MAG: N-6 DNA methylase [Candidatus Sulfotelmatobacter sp.]
MPTDDPDAGVPDTSAFEEAHKKVRQLVEVFQANHERFTSSDYSEAQARIDFIDKFWIALGWDVNHERQTNPYEQEVKVERGVLISGRGRRADYAFLAPNFRDVRFFVEAKRPGPSIDTPDDYFQLIRYGWNSHTLLSVLTSFEYFRVVDCRYKPDIDFATQYAVADLGFHYLQYVDPESFAKIYYLFSRAAVAEGSLERYAESLPKPSGRAVQRGLFPSAKAQPFDEVFLQELDGFREELAKSFKRTNPSLDSEDLTEATQRTLDRLVFMRFLEDKLIESEPIVETLGTRGGVWPDFVAESRRLDHVYNGIIFKEHALLDSRRFRIENEVFEGIREKLAHTNSPYAFNYIPIHVLGSIYERFLGKVIVATERSARVEPKPEVRKAKGVYYTPEYIVRYIVQSTIGMLVAKKPPEEIATMRFADIACGSGSFLLGIYDSLLRRHVAFYNAKGNRSRAREAGCIEADDGTLHLSLRQKREILLNNIYGVDIDAQAVEVAQLSLYLKLLEEETTASARHYQLEFGESLLPALGTNIVCGNSLVGWDYGDLFGARDEAKLKPLDLESTIARGGFDAVVGNPPWLMAGYYPDEPLDYLRQRYQTAEGKFDLYYTFIERGLALLKSAGLFGMIVPNKLFHTKAATALRQLLAEAHAVRQIVDFGDEQIFHGATNYSCILLLDKQTRPTFAYKRSLAGLEVTAEYELPTRILSAQPWHFEAADARKVFQKMERAGAPLADLTTRFGTGVQSGADRILTADQRMAKQSGFEASLLQRVFRGRDVRKYCTPPDPKLLIFPYTVKGDKFWILPESQLRKHRFIYSYLVRHRNELSRRIWFGKTAEELSGKWYGMMYLDSHDAFSAPHLLTPSLSRESNFALSKGDLFATGTAGVTSVIPRHDLPEDIHFLLALLNSRLLSLYATNHSPVFSGGFYKFSAPYLKKIPIRRINFTESADRQSHDRIVELVKQIIAAKKQLFRAKKESDKTLYQNKSAALERQIDKMVYELYGLTAEEIAVVEAAK